MEYPSKSLFNEKIDINSGDLYYFCLYWTWPQVKDLPKDDNRRIVTSRILNFKNTDSEFSYGHEKAFVYFRECIRKHYADLSGAKWIACSIPGHDQTLMISNNMDKFLDFCKLPNNILTVPCLITRKKAMEEKHGLSYGERTPQKDYDSFKLRNNFDIKGKNIIIFDDITTSGSSLVAARRFLKDNGANIVVCIALGKTVDYYV